MSVSITNPKLRCLIRLDADEPSSVKELLRIWQRTPQDLVRTWTRDDFVGIKSGSSNSDEVDRRIARWIGTTPLHLAAGALGPNARALSEILRSINSIESSIRPSVEFRDARGATALSRAVRSDCAARIHALVQAGANPSDAYLKSKRSIHRYQWSYLRFAAATGRISALAALLSQGADYVTSSNDGKRPIHLAIERGRLNCVQTLLSADLASIEAIGDERLRKATALDRFLVKNATSKMLSDSSGQEAGSSTSIGDDFEEPDLSSTAARFSTLSEWEIGSASVSMDVMEGVSTPGPREQDIADTRTNPFGTSQTDANNSIGGIDGLSRIIQQALRQAMGTSNDQDTVTMSMALGMNRDRGSSLYHLAASYCRPRVLRYLLNNDSLRRYHSHDIRNEQGKVPIFMAARSGSIPCIAMFIQQDVDINSVDLENWTVLNEAVKYNRIEAVRYILASGGSVTISDDDAWNPLHVAGRFGVVDAVAPLVDAGGDIDSLTEDKETPLLLACSQKGQVQVVRELLRLGASHATTSTGALSPLKMIVDRKDYTMLEGFLQHFVSKAEKNLLDLSALNQDGENFLFNCVNDDKPKIISYLLGLGVSADVRDSSGDTPLCSGIRQKNLRVVRALLEGGANPDFPTLNGTCAIHSAADEGFAEVMGALVQFGADMESPVPHPAIHVGFTPLMLAARRGHTSSVEALINSGVNLNVAKSDGYTAVHLASLNGQVDSLRVLLSAGADHSAVEENNFAPLHVAVRNNQLEVVRTLLTAGVDPDIRGPSGLTALHFAAYMANARMIWLLLSVGADVNAEDTEQSTPLHVAAGRERGRVAVQMLLTQGARVSAPDMRGDTPLHAASFRGIYTVVRVLLRRGASINAQNNLGLAPLHISSEQGYETTVNSLIHAGAEVGIKNKSGETPYQLAARSGKTDVKVALWRAMGQTLDDVAPVTKYAIESPAPSPRVSMDIAMDIERGRTLCVICQNVLRFQDEVRELPCGHVYKKECIDQWFGSIHLDEHNNCPLCQASVLPDELQEIRIRESPEVLPDR